MLPRSSLVVYLANLTFCAMTIAVVLLLTTIVTTYFKARRLKLSNNLRGSNYPRHFCCDLLYFGVTSFENAENERQFWAVYKRARARICLVSESENQ